MTLDEILSLTSLKPVSRREKRYLGGAFSLSLEDLSPDEQPIVKSLYDQLQELFSFLKSDADVTAADKQKLQGFLRQSALPALQEQLFSLQEEARDQGDKARETVFYSLASGALSSIVGYVLILSQSELERDYLQALYYLTRDHLKVSRNLIADLDPVKRAADEAPKYHSLDLLQEKWESVTYRGFEAEIDVAFHQYHEGHIAERCLEFSEIDNIFYHLANNALQYGQKAVLDIGVAPVNEGRDLRWVFRNPITRDQEEAIRERSAKGAHSLFEHGITTHHKKGEGFGLGSVADTILHAYGLEDLFEAEKQGYYGWKIIDHQFVLWFHWPAIDTK